jgi:hypothetical protein
MSKKRKVYRPRPVRLNACTAALERNRVMKQAVTGDFTDELEVAALAAIDAIARGYGTKDQWDTLANCLNHGWLLAKAGLGEEARGTFNDAHEAMRRMVPVYHQTGKLAFQSKRDQETIESAIAIWIEQLKIITIGELASAMKVVEENYWKHQEA